MQKEYIPLMIMFHPDDPEWIVGDLGSLVDTDLVLLTKGGANEVLKGDFVQSSQKGDIRIQEQREAMAIRRMGRLFSLDLPDAHLGTLPLNDIVPHLLHIVDLARDQGTVYNRIISLRPFISSRGGKKRRDGFTGHPDHIRGAEAVEELWGLRPQFTELRQAVMPPEQWQFWPRTWRLGNKRIRVPVPDIVDCLPVSISSDARAMQLAAITKHKSQFEGRNGGQRQIGRLKGTPPTEYYRVYTRP